MAIDGDGNLYVVDHGNDRIQKFGAGPVPVKKTTWSRLKSNFGKKD